MICFRIPYTDRFGGHEATKWGHSPSHAAGFLREALANRGCGVSEVGAPVPVDPQPFGFSAPTPAELGELTAGGAAAGADAAPADALPLFGI